jgi:hypothetical protein
MEINQGEGSVKWMNKISTKNDTFTRVHEDPILMIKQEEKRAREKVLSNPLKMDKIRQKIATDLQREEADKKAKKEKKRAAKKLKKQESKEKKESKKRKRENEQKK